MIYESDFMFQLTDEEWKNLRSQIVIFNKDTRKYKPYAFIYIENTDYKLSKHDKAIEQIIIALNSLIDAKLCTA